MTELPKGPHVQLEVRVDAVYCPGQHEEGIHHEGQSMSSRWVIIPPADDWDRSGWPPADDTVAGVIIAAIVTRLSAGFGIAVSMVPGASNVDPD